MSLTRLINDQVALEKFQCRKDEYYLRLPALALGCALPLGVFFLLFLELLIVELLSVDSAVDTSVDCDDNVSSSGAGDLPAIAAASRRGLVIPKQNRRWEFKRNIDGMDSARNLESNRRTGTLECPEMPAMWA